MEKEHGRISKEIERLSKKHCDFYLPEINIHDTELIIMQLSEQDLTKRKDLLETDYEILLRWYYIKQIIRLNEKIDLLETLRGLENG